MAQPIADPVYLGDERDALEPDREYDEILTIAADETDNTTHHFPVGDGESAIVGPGTNGTLTEGTRNFIKSVEWLMEYDGPGPVLVHCRSGVNRSACVVAAWYALDVLPRGYATMEAMFHIKHQRKIVSPHPSQMAMYALTVSKLRPDP